MSYQSCIATYHEMRERFRGVHDAQRMIADFGMEVALGRVADVLHTSDIAYIVIEGVRNRSKQQQI